MTQTRRILGRMVPALEGSLPQSSVGDIISVPTVNVLIQSGPASVTCAGLIDTGADFCVLDTSVFKKLDVKVLAIDAKTLASDFSTRRVSVYLLDLRLRGEAEEQELFFEGVPIAVTSLHRPILIIGRRGVLERLRLDINYPQGTISITMAQHPNVQYPTLSSELPGFQLAVELIEKDATMQSMVVLAIEIERFLDTMITLQRLSLTTGKELSSKASFTEKLHAICDATHSDELIPDIETMVTYRNIAAHAPASAVMQLSPDEFLATAERIVSVLSRKQRAQ